MLDIRRGLALGALALFAVTLVAAVAVADTPSIDPPTSFHATRNVKIIDADTVDCDYQLFGSIWAVGERVRADYDAWESFRTRRSSPFSEFTEAEWIAENRKGDAAKDDLAKLLQEGQLYLSPKRGATDPFGRTIAKYYVLTKTELIDVAQWMDERGHLRRPQLK